MKEVKDIINRVKRLQEFEVCVKLPEQFEIGRAHV